MKKNIWFVMLGELILLSAVFMFNALTSGFGFEAIAWFIDLPSILFVLFVLIPGLLIMGEWKDFKKSFSVGIKEYSLLELKNIIEAVGVAQKLTIYGALLAIIIYGVLLMGQLQMDPAMIGPSLAVCFLSGFYAIIIEFFLLPLKLNAERKMNEEMDFGDE